MRHANPVSNPSGLLRHSLPISLLAMLHLATLVVLSLVGSESHADVDLPSKFSNHSTIGNTRHNLTQRQTSGGSGPTGSIMDVYRNDYMEICVYCHTPHGANTTAGAPLWNRVLPSTTYTVYSSLSLTQTISQPGAASLVCLSCHDGQQAVDAIMNMPGSGRYQATPDATFLNSWNNSRGPDATVHIGLNGVTPALGCLACHSSGAGFVGAGATDFTVAAIGTDLRDDHPVGVTFPTSTGGTTDWRTPDVNGAGTKFFDDNTDTRMNKGEIRLYGTGASATVECGSCHDPHGVTNGSSFNATFLRKPNAGSAVCLTCHAK